MKEVFIPEIKSAEPREELPSVAQFREFREAISVIYATKPESEAFKFNQPSSFSRQAFELFISEQKVPDGIAKFYYPDVPCPFDLAELPDDKLAQLIQTFGPDIVRTKMVSKSVAEGNGVILPAGGACLIETFGTEMLQTGACKNPNIRAETAQKLIDNVPYYTQVTGTMLMGGKAKMGLMYREEFPWYLRAQEYGVQDAFEQTVAAYDRIVTAQIRRGQLIDPEFSLITLPFSTLDLEKEGLLREWFDMAFSTIPNHLRRGKPNYDPEGFLLSWVRYTYGGPKILEVVRGRLETQGISLNGTSMHVRTKQLDHLGEPTDLLRDLDRISYEELMRMRKYQAKFGLAIDSYLASSVNDQGIGFVGFDDFTVDGDIVHKTPFIEIANGSHGKRAKIPQAKEQVDEVLSSIVRLNTNNLDEHIAFLDFIVSVGPEQALTIKNVLNLRRAIQNISKELLQLPEGTKRNQLIDILTKKQAELNNVPEELQNISDMASGFPKVSILPISENLIVSHAIQLAFDPDMRGFVCDAASIETGDMPEYDKRILLMQKMQEILPKIKQYLTFIMRGGEYPSLRFERIYIPIRR